MSLVQAVSKNLTVAGTTQTSAAINTTAKNCILFCAAYNAANAGVATPSDSTAQVWTLIATYTGGVTGLALSVWVAKNITGSGTNTFTLATAGADTPSFFVAEFNGRDLVVPFDQFITASDTVASTGVHTTGSMNARGGSDLLAFNVSSALAQTYAAVGEWAIPPNGTITTAAGHDAFIQYINSANNGENDNTYSVTVSDKLDAFIVSLKPPALPYGDEWLDQFNEVPEIYPVLASYQQQDIVPQLAEVDSDWNDDCGENDAWIGVEDQSAPVIANNVTTSVAQYFGDDAELADEALDFIGFSIGGQQSDNTPPIVLEEPWDWFQEIDDDEWLARDESNVQMPNVVDITSQVFSESIEWEEDALDFALDDYQLMPADLPQNDTWDHFPTDDDDYVVTDDFLNITNPGALPLNIEDAWDHWPTDDDDWTAGDDYENDPNRLLAIEDPWWWDDELLELVVIPSGYQASDHNPVITLEDAWDHWPTEDDEYFIVDEYALVDFALNALLNVEDPWDFNPNDPDDELYHQLDTDPVGPTLVIPFSMPPEDPTDWTQEEDDYVTPDDYAVIDVVPNPQLPVEDPYDHWPTEDNDDYVVTDDYSSVNNKPITVEDPWDHWTTDPDDETYQSLDTDPVTVPQPSAIEDPTDWTQDADDEEWIFRDSYAVEGFVGLGPPADGWDHWLTDEDDYVTPDDYAIINLVIPPSQFTDDSWDWFYEPAEDNEQDYAVTDFALVPNVYIYDPNFEVYMPLRNWVAMWLPTGLGTF